MHTQNLQSTPSTDSEKSSVITLTLPYPPSVNHYWGVRGIHRYLGVKGKFFRLKVSEAVATLNRPTLTGRIAVFVSLYPPDKRNRDIDNVLKALLDALEHAGCYENDSQIDDIRIVRCEPRKGGSCVVVIVPIESGGLPV